MKPSSTSVDAIAVKFDFHTDDDAAKTTTGGDAMTSATGVWLDCVMPINQWSRADSRACVTSSDGSPRATETAVLTPEPRATVCSRVGRTRTCGVPCTALRRPREPTHVHLSIGQLRWMSVDCIQMSARVGFALRSLVPPINGDHYA